MVSLARLAGSRIRGLVSRSHLRHYHGQLFGIVLLLELLTLISQTVIPVHGHNDHRCTHLPPPPEPVQHVWLNEANFSAESQSVQSGQQRASEGEESADLAPRSRSGGSAEKFKRQVVDASRPRPYVSALAPDSSFQDSLWNLIRKFERPKQALEKEVDLVPMKIQVHYDSSVHSLDTKRQTLIKDHVIPNVVKFFENVLSIRQDYTIDRFRISRRCPNNTIYYARDAIGSSRPYCMDRCEDHAICGEMVVPKEHLSACSYCNTTSRRCTTNYDSEGKGVANTQLLLYVSAKQTIRCKKDQTIAYAAHCAQDTKTDRPVAGHANLCPSSISTDRKDLKALIATVKHELTHVLGFSVSLFAYYRDENGQPLTERELSPGPIPVDPRTGYARWSDRVIKKYVRQNWLTGEGLIDKEVQLVVTPTVVREVRRHFNCSTLEGAELEDQGSDGTSMTHWEKRLFENEAMTGTHTQNSVYSRITLAVLQDTGWYVANFNQAEKLEWGRELGCDFAKKSCKSWINERRARQLSIRPFCDHIKGDQLQIACTEDRGSKAVCNMRNYSEPLPQVYQNFDQLDGVHHHDLAHYGGSVDLADYCPFIQEFTWQAHNVTVRGSRCDSVGSTFEAEKNAALEHYGPEARCFEHGRRWEQRSCSYKRHWHHFGAGCYLYSCAEGHISVLVGNHSYPCYYAGQQVHVQQIVDHWLYNGTIICPACDKLCPNHKCKLYDRRLIDKILDYAHDPLYSGETKNNSIIFQAMFDDAYNLIETQSERARDAKLAKTKALPTNDNATQSQPTNSNHRDKILDIFRRQRKTPKQALLCSSAVGFKNELRLPWTPLISFITIILATSSTGRISIPSRRI